MPPADSITEGKRYDCERREKSVVAESFLFAVVCVRIVVIHLGLYQIVPGESIRNNSISLTELTR